MWALLINGFVKNEEALAKLLESVARSDWTDEPILVVTGGCKAPTSIEHETHGRVSFLRVRVPHNSLDYTSMIALIQLPDPRLVFDHYMYIHDTCAVEPLFFKTIGRHVDKLPAGGVAPVSQFPSMNMGLYPRSAFFGLQGFLLSRKSSDEWTPEEVDRLKTEAVSLEDAIFVHQPSVSFVMSPKVLPGEQVVYSTGTVRAVNYFPEAQLFKYQANWFAKPKYSLDL